MPELSTSHRCFNCNSEIQSLVAFCPQCNAPFPVMHPFLRRLFRALAGSVLILLSWWCGMSGLITLFQTPRHPQFTSLGLALLFFAAASFAGYRYLSK